MSCTPSPLTTRVVSTIREAPQDVWDRHIACGHPFKSSAFLGCLEDSFPQRRFSYVLMSRGAALVGLAVVTEEQLDLGLLLPKAVERLVSAAGRVLPGLFSLRLGMVGTFETAQRHWWFDPEQVSAVEFTEALLDACDKVCSRSTLLLVRDFTVGDAQDERLEAGFLAKGFKRLANLPLSVVKLDGLSIDAHLQRLKAKSRYAIRKELRRAAEAGLKIERVRDFRHLVDACYPLYLQVHEHATEFKRSPFPKVFFETVAQRLAGVCNFLVLRTRDERLVAFLLTSTDDVVGAAYLIGMDYAVTRQTPAYYYLLWKEIEHAARQGCRTLDLGLTSYFIKQTLGAELEKMNMAARLRSAWLRPLLQPLLPVLLHSRQPAERRKFRIVKDHGQGKPGHDPLAGRPEPPSGGEHGSESDAA